MIDLLKRLIRRWRATTITSTPSSTSTELVKLGQGDYTNTYYGDKS